jgi:hypothetical protein
MAFYIYAHEMGQSDYVRRCDTKAEAMTAVRQIRLDCSNWSSEPLPRLEISTDPPYVPTYQFPDMSSHG